SLDMTNRKLSPARSCIQVNSVPSWSFDVPPSAPPSVAPANIFSISSIINGTGAMRLAGPDSVRNLSKVHSQDAQRLTRAETKQNGLFSLMRAPNSRSEAIAG